jgi:ribosomal protein S14
MLADARNDDFAASKRASRNFISETLPSNTFVNRYKKMAEQHHKETKAAKQAQAVGEHDSGYRFDLGLCRRTFDEYDKDMSGYLDIRELTNLAEVFY